MVPMLSHHQQWVEKQIYNNVNQAFLEEEGINAKSQTKDIEKGTLDKENVRENCIHQGKVLHQLSMIYHIHINGVQQSVQSRLEEREKDKLWGQNTNS